ncbi:SEC-C domain-containing protein [Vibrio sp. Of7-15]|uniref:YchJ family metal-binding protein n=1 Tax=Vibrio sp. Of7-15 TaxID=2724879 RepID=UPI001EF36C95|nr:YchJ family metal-binding protein [Vibrio sp. Of7-15]MCG7495975.1 SEC-C domain-containing protein [Vibrio sp. Of7-15]
MKNCPCGNQKNYSDCCEPVHISPLNAKKPEQLMRARYCAHVLGLVDFVIQTYHSSCNAEQHREGIAESINSEWRGLEVLSSSIRSENEGFVEFKAHFSEEGNDYVLHENSRFVREDQQWFYIDGEYPEQAAEAEVVTPDKKQNTAPAQSDKIGRNDPCVCGSGKKYKKCCG